MAGVADPMRVLALALLLALAGCGDGERKAARGAAAQSGAPARAREGQLDVLAIAGAVAGDGALFKAFEQDSDCKLRLRTASGASELLELASQADADLVLASGDTAASLVASGRVQALRATAASAALEPAFRQLRGAVVDGRRYGLPFRWQANVLAYDSALRPQAPTSWQALFEPGEDAGAPQLLAGAEPIALADAAIYLSATRPELRIADPYELDEAQYAAALSLLKRQRASLRGVARDVAAQADGFRNGVVASASTPAQVRALQAEGLPVAWTLPAEGGSAQVEIAMLQTGARHPNCALAWMAWAQTAAVQSRLAAAAGAMPVTRAACALAPLATGDACASGGMELLPKLHPQTVPQARCGKRQCVPYSRWTRDYLALVGE